MANRLYGKGKEALASAEIDWENDDIRVILIDTGEYTVDLAEDEFLDDIPSEAIVGSAEALDNKTNTLGVLDADDVTFAAVTGASVEAIVLYKHTGTDADSQLLVYLDGKAELTIAANASSSGTNITVDALPEAVSNGAILTKVTGTGPATITLTASASAGARSLSVSALSSNVNADAVYEYSIADSGLPITPNGGDIKIAWSSGNDKIVAL
jgi:hypothetical protein